MARIAILGISIESNAFAPTASIQSFRDYAYLEGEEILSAGVVDYWLGVNSGHGFVPAMNRLRPWTPLPILIADGQASGAVEHSDYQAIRANLLRRLADSLPVDAVYIVAHGAGRTTELDDLDGDYFAAVRELVGDAIPIVATLDLHANLTPEMVAACDALVSQRTNPHVDSEARAEDAALLIDRMIDGWRPLQVAVRLPMLTPQVSQLTDSGEPLGVIVAQAEESLARGDCVGVSIIPGFSFADTPENGFWLYALGDDEPKLVMTLSDLAQDVWRMKTRFVRSTLSVERAVQIAAEPGLSGEATDGPVVFADIADNPGGGATGNTTWLLKVFLDAGVTGGVFAPFIDNDLVATAMQVGMGGEFLARFNATSESVFSRRLDAPAKVRWLGIGDYDSRYGVYAGSRVPLGQCCVLEVGGNLVVVTSVQQQLLGADFISHFGIDVAAARFIVAKSRGHFRAGFAHMVDSRRIFEVDTPGLTTATLSDVPWRSLTRPIVPLDAIESWEPELRIVRPRQASP